MSSTLRCLNAAYRARARAEAAILACFSSLDRPELAPEKKAIVERMGLARLAEYDAADAAYKAALTQIRVQS